MKKKFVYAALVITMLFVILPSCRQFNPASPDVPVYTFSPDGVQPGSSFSVGTTPPPSPPQATPAEEYVKRDITVTDQNSIFSIGVPSGYVERTEVIARKPLDYWFEYLPAEAKLEIDGKEIQRDPFKWETKIGYTKSATSFIYIITNDTASYVSYNLRLVPSVAGMQVPVVIHQRWIP